MKEVWRSIPGFEDYEVSNLGEVRNLKTHRILKPSLRTKKPHYLGINLRKSGVTHYKRIHQLVMLAFVGPCPEGMVVCHNNDDPADNRLSNLRYDTHSKNTQDALERERMGKLTHQQVEQIREGIIKSKIARTHKSPDRTLITNIEELARQHNVSTSVICSVMRGRTYKNVAGPLYTRTMSTEDVVKIRELYATGKYSLSEVARKFLRDPGMISKIINGKKYPEVEGPIKGVDY